jgi:hypothetical protein
LATITIATRRTYRPVAAMPVRPVMPVRTMDAVAVLLGWLDRQS